MCGRSNINRFSFTVQPSKLPLFCTIICMQKLKNIRRERKLSSSTCTRAFPHGNFNLIMILHPVATFLMRNLQFYVKKSTCKVVILFLAGQTAFLRDFVDLSIGIVAML